MPTGHINVDIKQQKESAESASGIPELALTQEDFDIANWGDTNPFNHTQANEEDIFPIGVTKGASLRTLFNLSYAGNAKLKAVLNLANPPEEFKTTGLSIFTTDSLQKEQVWHIIKLNSTQEMSTDDVLIYVMNDISAADYDVSGYKTTIVLEYAKIDSDEFMAWIIFLYKAASGDTKRSFDLNLTYDDLGLISASSGSFSIIPLNETGLAKLPQNITTYDACNLTLPEGNMILPRTPNGFGVFYPIPSVNKRICQFEYMALELDLMDGKVTAAHLAANSNTTNNPWNLPYIESLESFNYGIDNTTVDAISAALYKNSTELPIFQAIRENNSNSSVIPTITALNGYGVGVIEGLILDAKDKDGLSKYQLLITNDDVKHNGKSIITRPTFFKITGNAMADTGGTGQTYLISNENVVPANKTMEVNDVVIFYTTLAYYIGVVTEVNGNGATVTVKQRLGYILPEITDADEGKVLKISSGKLTWADETI